MTRKTRTETLADLLSPYVERIEGDLRLWLVEPDTPAELGEAMEYCALGAGKRLRPALVYMAAGAVGGCDDDELTRRAAVAVELIHCYSLVHDDLPAMDDDTLRRGRPTAHVQFGEAMAILVGDALLTRAFGVLSECTDPRASLLTAQLARAAGPAGMIAGQVADMDLCKVPSGLEGLTFIHDRKTAALIKASARMGALCGRAKDGEMRALSEYGRALGLAFQLIDDLLDATSSSDQLGKTAGKDQAAGKRTHLVEVGIDKARTIASDLTRQATEAIARLGARGSQLRKLAELLAERTR